MKKNNKHLTADEKDMLKLIDKITATINIWKATSGIRDTEELLLKRLAEDREVVMERAEGRFEYEERMKNSSKTEDEIKKLERISKASAALDEEIKKVHTGLQVLYYQLLYNTDKTPEA